MEPDQQPSPWRYFGLGMEYAAAILILMFLGHLVDRWLDTRPWGLVVGALVGLIGGTYNLIKIAMKANR